MTLLKNSFLAISILIAISLMGISMSLPPVASIILIAVSFVLAMLAAGMAIYLHSKGKKHPRFTRIYVYLAITFLLVAILLASSYSFFQKDIRIAHEHKGMELGVSGRADQIVYSEPYASLVAVTLTEIDGRSVDLKAMVEFNTEAPLSELDEFTLVGVIDSISGDDSYLVADGYSMVITASMDVAVQVTGRAGRPWYAPFKDISRYFSNVLDSFLNPEAAVLTRAMLLGDRSELGSDTSRDFRRIGISHMLALSGLHVAVILGGFDMLLCLFRIDKTKRSIFLIIGSIVYLGITGLSLSAARAVIMACIVYLAYIVSDEADSLNSLFIAAFIILAIFPSAFFDIGFWMSFFATLSLIIVAELISPLTFKIKKKPWYIQLSVHLLSAVATTIAATVGTVAFVWLNFKEISVVSILSNLIFSIPTTIVLGAGAVLLVLHWIPFVSVIPAFILNITVKVFGMLSSRMSSLRGITVSLNYEFVKFIIVPMLVVTLVFALIYLRRKWLIAMPTAAAILAFVICLNCYNKIHSNTSSVVYIKNESSEMVTVANTEGVAVCDMSTGGFYNFKLAYDAVVDQNGTEIEKLILTHYHQYHPNSVKRVCEAYMVREIYLPAPEKENDIKWYNTICSKLEGMNTKIRIYTPGDTLQLGDSCTIELSEHYYIKRSVHPMYYVTVTDSDESFTYLSAAICDSDSYHGVKNADHIVFGTHGPNIHNIPKYSNYDLSHASTVILSNPIKQWSEELADDVPYISAEDEFGFEINLDGIK